MADRNGIVAKPIWMKQAEEAKLKSEAETTAAAKAAFEATFKDVEKSGEKQVTAGSDSESEEYEDLSKKPIGPVDPTKCTAAGAGIAGGTACAPSTFMLVTKDSDGRKIPNGGALIKVKVSPGVGVGGTEQEGVVKDMGDGTYTVTYVVPKRGNYMLNIECNGKVVMGSPFPVFFSQGTSTGGMLGMTTPPSTYPNLVNQTMPNMPNYTGSVSGAFPGLLGMIPGVVSGASGGAILPGIGASLGEVCREYFNGRCAKTDCKLNHPPHNLLMTALAATTSLGTLSQVPMAPSAAAMAAAQAIVAAQALQAHAAQMQAKARANDSSGSLDKAAKAEALKKTIKVSNISPLLTIEQLKQLCSFCGTVTECTISDSKHFAHVEYSNPKEASAALALNNMDVCGQPLNVEMAKSLPEKPSDMTSSMASSSLMMQQAVAMQQMQFQQALVMQQTMTAQQAANKAATMKSATELAATRAAEISRKLKPDGDGNEGNETKPKSRSPSPSVARPRSKSRSPINHRRRRRSPYSPPDRRFRDHRSRSPSRSHRRLSYNNDRRFSRDTRDGYGSRRWDSGRSYDYQSSISRRKRSFSPRTRRSYRADSNSPRRRRESSPHRETKSSRTRSRSPGQHRGSRSSPRNDDKKKTKYRKRSRSKSVEGSNDKRDEKLNYRSRKQSRSLSPSPDKRRERSLSSPSPDESKLKNRRESRSNSLEVKCVSIGKKDESDDIGFKDGEAEDIELNDRDTGDIRSKDHEAGDIGLKDSERRLSRSLQDKRHTREKRGENRDRKSKHRERRRSRSLSPEGKHKRGSMSSPRYVDENKQKHRRRSRSRSVENKQYSSDVSRDEGSKRRERRRSKSPDGKHRKGRKSSPGSFENASPKQRRHKSKSEKDKPYLDNVRDETRDNISINPVKNLDKTGGSGEMQESTENDSMNLDDGLLSNGNLRSSENMNIKDSSSSERCETVIDAEELGFDSMQNGKPKELDTNESQDDNACRA